VLTGGASQLDGPPDLAKQPDIRELKPRITVFGVGGAGGNAVNNMITPGCRASTSSSPTPTRRRSPCRRPSASSRWARR
jgi:hypothetical protein